MKKIIYTFGSLALFVPSLSFAHMGDVSNWDGMMDWGGWFWSVVFLWIFIWVLGIVGLILFLRWIFTYGRKETPDKNRTIEILKERYAKGEISKKEFEEVKRDLEK